MGLQIAKSEDNGKVPEATTELFRNYNWENDNDNHLAEYQLAVIKAKISNRASCLAARMLRPGDFKMTPQEQLFADFFNDEAKVIDGLSDLELRMHREELAKIAFEAKARLTKVDEEERSRKAKNKKSTGILASVESDELTTDAINKIQLRQKKLNKAEKLIAGMIEMGMDRAEAEAMIQAGTVLGRLRGLGDKTPVTESDSKPVTNPFANLTGPDKCEICEQIKTKLNSLGEEKVIKPKQIKGNIWACESCAEKETKTTTEVIISDEVTTVIVAKEESEVKVFNPFAGLTK